jgi:hypothetical protein
MGENYNHKFNLLKGKYLTECKKQEKRYAHRSIFWGLCTLVGIGIFSLTIAGDLEKEASNLLYSTVGTIICSNIATLNLKKRDYYLRELDYWKDQNMQ